jgi:hypothetical protein
MSPGTEKALGTLANPFTAVGPVVVYSRAEVTTQPKNETAKSGTRLFSIDTRHQKCGTS